MQIKSRLFRFITVIVLTVCGILTLIFLEFTHTPAQSSDFPIPADAELILSIDARQLTMQDFKELVFLKNDAKLVENLIERVKARRDNKEGELSIDVLHRIVFYTVHRHGTSYLAFLFYINSEDEFLETAKKMGHSSYAVENDVAILLTPITGPKNASPSLAKELLHAPAMKLSADNNAVIAVKTGAKSSALPGLNAAVHITDHRLLLSGSFKSVTPETSEFTVKHEGLFIHSMLLPQQLLDSLNAHIPTVNLKIPNVRYLDMDYRGIAIDNSDGIKALPRINSVICSEKSIAVSDILAEIPEKYKHGDTIVLPGISYIIRQLDDHTIFFGTNPANVLRQRSNDILCIDGHLGNLTDIQASPMILSVIEIVAPQLRPAREFAMATENIHFCAGKNGSNKVEAVIEFKKDKSAYVEFTRLFLGLQAVND